MSGAGAGPIAFRCAVEARDLDALRASLAPDVRFFPPIRYRPLEGREAVALALSVPAQLFAFTDSFRYTHELSDDHGWYGLFFRAELPDGKEIEGVDQLHLDGDGLVSELRIMTRPAAQVQDFERRAGELVAGLSGSP